MTRAFDNVFEKKELEGHLFEAFETISGILTEHAGPFATNAIIGSRWRQVNDLDEFTKDGIKILYHLIVSEHAVARLVARMARLVGRAVDSRCHDGTTTSMLLFSYLGKIALRHISSDTYNGDKYRWARHLENACELLELLTEDLRITDEELFARATSFGIDTTIEDVRKAMAFHMAMISSKGEVDLSQKVAEVIRSTPKQIYGMFRNSPLNVETKEKFVLKKQAYDIVLHGNMSNANDFNYMNGTQFRTENAVIFYSGNEIVLNSFESAFLKSFISDRPDWKADLTEFGVSSCWDDLHEDKRQLLIISPMINDPELYSMILEYNKRSPKTKIATFTANVSPKMKQSLTKTIQYMSGKQLFPDVMHENALLSMIGLDGRPVTAHLIGNDLALYNLYEKTGAVYHPYHDDPEAFPDYTKFKGEVEEMIAYSEKNITNPYLEEGDLTYLTHLYRTLTCQTIFDIEVGGSAHDQLANRTVYEDAIGAALSAMKEGVVLSGYAHLSRKLQTLIGTKGTTELPVDSRLLDQFGDAMLKLVHATMRCTNGVNDLGDWINDSLTDKWHFIAADRDRYFQGDTDTYVGMGYLDKETMERFLKCDPNHTILFQAYAGYEEQFKRFKDMLPRLANTSHLIDMRKKDGDEYN